jgi:hypothetical protein
MVLPFTSSSTEVRNRLSRSSAELHTGHGQPITGTPIEVPVPGNVMRKVFRVAAVKLSVARIRASCVCWLIVLLYRPGIYSGSSV